MNHFFGEVHIVLSLRIFVLKFAKNRIVFKIRIHFQCSQNVNRFKPMCFFLTKNVLRKVQTLESRAKLQSLLDRIATGPFWGPAGVLESEVAISCF